MSSAPANHAAGASVASSANVRARITRRRQPLRRQCEAIGHALDAIIRHSGLTDHECCFEDPEAKRANRSRSSTTILFPGAICQHR
jgi:hypothetical protein